MMPGHRVVEDGDEPVKEQFLTIAEELAEVTRLVEADDVTGTLERLVARAVAAIPDCDHAAITVRSRGAVETVTPGDEELLGNDLVPGPVLEAVTYGEPRRLEDAASDQRWPSFSARMANSGYRSCVVLPLPVQGEQTAVFSLFSVLPNAFTDASFDIALLFTLHAGVAFDNVGLYSDSKRLIEQLTTALHTRTTIGQAQGLLMRHFGCDRDEAFTLLRTTSQNGNRKLRAVAEALVSAHENDEFPSVLQKLGME